MSDLLVNEPVTCPHCWETITLAIDTSVPEQEYVEDCPVCCRPSVIRYAATEGEIVELTIEPESA